MNSHGANPALSKAIGPGRPSRREFQNRAKGKNLNEKVLSIGHDVPALVAKFWVVPWATEPIQPISCQQVCCLKKSDKAAARRLGPDKARSAAAKSQANTARKGRFKNSVRGRSVTTASFLAGPRTPWGGQDNDESESVVDDFNGDGKMNVARVVTDTDGNAEVSVLPSHGDGTFQTAVITALPADTDAPFLVGDWKGDGKADLVLVQPFRDNCDRAHSKAKPKAAKAQPQITIPCGASVIVFLSDGQGGFGAPVDYPVWPQSLQGGLLTDVDGDGKLDITLWLLTTPSPQEWSSCWAMAPEPLGAGRFWGG